MENIIASLLEKSLVGGAFLYMLWMFTTKFNVTLENIADTLHQVSHTLTSLENRVSKLEEKKNE